MKRVFSALVAALSFIAVASVLSTAAWSQGRYANTYSKQQVSTIIANLEQSSNRFTLDFNREMDRSSYNGTRDEDRFNANVRDYASSLDRLRRQFDRNNSWWASRQDVQEVLNRAQTVNTMMNAISFRRNLERQWNRMRDDLNKLADTFDMPGLEGGGYTGGPYNRGNGDGRYNPGNGEGRYNGQMSRPPSWALGTFYSTNGSNIMMTISPNGQVSVVNNGSTYYGGFYRNNIVLNGDTSDISQTRNGIRTYNRNTGETTNYTRTEGRYNGGYNGNGGVVGGGIGDRVSAPPSWAVGTFYSTSDPQVTMTIGSDGRINLFTNGQSYYGTYYQGSMTLNGDTSTITQTRNGIRTYNQNTGQTTDYRRR
jgi:hypothetical protein